MGQLVKISFCCVEKPNRHEAPVERALAGYVPHIRALDVATGTVHALGLQGVFPVYSPDGAHIAYVSGSALMVANSDGTKARSLWGSSGTSIMAPSWSADGKWILSPQPNAGASLVRVSDGVVLPLPFASSYQQLALH